MRTLPASRKVHTRPKSLGRQAGWRMEPVSVYANPKPLLKLPFWSWPTTATDPTTPRATEGANERADIKLRVVVVVSRDGHQVQF